MRYNDTDEMIMKKIKKYGLLFLVCGVLLLLATCSIKVIPSNHVGVKHLFGKVNDVPIYEGLNLKFPLTKVQKYSAKTEEYTMVSAIGEGAQSSSDSISAKTIENVEVGLDITVLYKIDKQQAAIIWREIGTQEQIISKIIRPMVRTRIRDIVAKYTKDEVNQQRTEVAAEMMGVIQKEVEPRGVIVENVLLRQITFPPKVQAEIDAKEAEKEIAAKMEFTIVKEVKEKERKVIEAEGIAEANDIIAGSITESYLRWYWIQSLDKYDAVTYIPIGNDALPIFKNVDSAKEPIYNNMQADLVKSLVDEGIGSS